ncbi:hypothetical protein AB0F13_11135 [Streptomyces sp. NPDC026206]|uniref:hypothetical protein n=1 Tax=Streptomyces sp. NPDC026206 TaxID=3157089 RepID=UPI0033C16452
MTTTPAPMGMAFRGMLIVGGGAVILLGIVLAFFWHAEVVELTGTSRLMSGLALRVFEAAALYGGSWLAVRGWNGRLRHGG